MSSMKERWATDPADMWEAEDPDPDDVEAQRAIRQILAKKAASSRPEATSPTHVAAPTAASHVKQQR